MIKKILAALTAAMICAGLAACGNTEGKVSRETTATSAVTTTTTAATEAAEAAAAEEEPKDADSSSNDAAAKKSISGNFGFSGKHMSDEKSEDTCGAPADKLVSCDSSDKEIIMCKEYEYDEPIITDNLLKAYGSTLRLCDKELLIMLESETEAEPAEEEVFAAIDAFKVQYRAAASRDLDAFLNTFRFADLADPTTDMLRDMIRYEDDADFQKYLEDSGQETKLYILDDVTSLIEDILDKESADRLRAALENADPERFDGVRKLIAEAFSGINASSQAVKDSIEYDTVYNTDDELEPLDGIDDSTVYIVNVDRCAYDKKSEGNDLYMSFSLMMLTKDKQYEIDDIIAWRVNGNYGVYLTDALYSDDDEQEFRGKNAREIFEQFKNELISQIESEKNAPNAGDMKGKAEQPT